MAIPENTSTSVIRSSTPIQFSHQIQPALNHENFLLWKSQILPVLRGHGLVSFINGSRPPPTQFLTTATGASIVNPDFEAWHQQDQLILAWIFSSISPSILSQLMRCETSVQAWSVLNQIHSSQSMAKILDLKLQLQTSKKGSSSCAQFLQQMQVLADRLRSIGTDVPDHDLILYITQGLGSEFESFVTALSMRTTIPSMPDFSSLLLSHEARTLLNLRSTSLSTVHLTEGSNSISSDNAAYYANTSRPPNLNQFPFRGTSRGHGRGNQRGRSRGRQINSSSDQLQCQICSKWGHSALTCYHRFDIRYTASSSPPPAVGSSSPHTNFSSSSHQALIAEPMPVPESPTYWYIDSGATTHVTSDLNTLSSSSPYSGPEAVQFQNT